MKKSPKNFPGTREPGRGSSFTSPSKMVGPKFIDTAKGSTSDSGERAFERNALKQLGSGFKHQT